MDSKNNKDEVKRVFAGLVVIVIAVFCGGFAQSALSDIGQGALGILIFCIVAGSVGYTLEKIVRHWFFS